MSSASRRSRTREKSGILYWIDDGIRRISNRDPVDLIQKIDGDAQFLGIDPDAEFTERLPTLPIPGAGDPYDDCGEKQPLKFCSRCGKPKHLPRRCRRVSCPDCWESGVKQQAVSIASKLEGRRRYEEAKVDDRWTGLKFHHVPVSMPHEFRVRRSDPLETGFEIVKQVMTELGGMEGVIVYHPWRIKEQHRGDVLGHNSGHGNKTWADILTLIEKRGFQPVFDEYLTYGPHFHVITLSQHVIGGEMTKHIEEKGGLIVERIADNNGVSVRDLPALCRAIGYSLSHAGLMSSDRGMDTQYRYFGEVADFEPSAGIEADVENAFDAISERILGVKFPDDRCTVNVEGARNEGESSKATVPSEIDLDDIDENECAGRDVRIGRAPEYLGDPDWVAGAPYADELVDAHQEYIEIEVVVDRPPPEPPPE